MAANTKPIFPLTPKSFGITFVNADGTSYKDVFTAGSNGAILDLLNIASTDTSARDIFLAISDGVTTYEFGIIRVAITAGTDGVTPAANGLDIAFIKSLGNREDRSIVLQSGWKLRARPTVAVTAAKTVTITGSYGDY